MTPPPEATDRQDARSGARVVVYATQWCPYCVRARALLEFHWFYGSMDMKPAKAPLLVTLTIDPVDTYVLSNEKKHFLPNQLKGRCSGDSPRRGFARWVGASAP